MREKHAIIEKELIDKAVECAMEMEDDKKSRKSLKGVVLRLGTRSLGPPTTEQLASLQQIYEFDRFENLLVRVFSALSWEDLLRE